MFQRIAEFIFLSIIYYTIMTQFLASHVISVVEHYQKEEWVDMVREFFKLPVPNTYAWLIFFYVSFHTWLNFLAEITGFADRLFY